MKQFGNCPLSNDLFTKIVSGCDKEVARPCTIFDGSRSQPEVLLTGRSLIMSTTSSWFVGWNSKSRSWLVMKSSNDTSVFGMALIVCSTPCRKPTLKLFAISNGYCNMVVLSYICSFYVLRFVQGL